MWLLVCLLCFPQVGQAQKFRSDGHGAAVTVLTQMPDTDADDPLTLHWRYQIDAAALNPAAPGLDDRAWSALPTNSSEAPHPVLHPFQHLWYRAHLRIPAGSKHLSLLLFGFQAGDRFYVNGHLLDSLGKLRPGEGPPLYPRRFFAVPDAALGTGELTLAIESDTGPAALLPFTPETVLSLGPMRVLEQDQQLLAFRNFTSNSVTIVIEALVLLLALALAVTVRSQSEYVTLVLLVGAFLLTDVVTTVALASSYLMTPGLQLLLDLGGLSTLLLMDLTRAILRLRRRRWLSRLYVIMGCVVVPVWVSQTAALYGHPGWPALQSLTWWLDTSVVFMPLAVLPLLCFWSGLEKRNGEALLLSFPLLFLGALASTVPLNGWHLAPNLYIAQAPVSLFYVKWSELARIFLCVTLLVLLVLRTVRIARERGVVVSELHAAQTVQQLLLDSSNTATPGFQVETAYLPASDVGGDFFFFSSVENGSLLLVIGDVSGKGLRAAMTVSAIVGALRALEEHAPAALLHMLNRALYGHMEGFATCCAVLVDRTGTMRLANAGNPAPYLNGVELQTAPGLPLGLDLQGTYDEEVFWMPIGSRLLFASDGVLEATNARSGELFGFERTALLAQKPARLVATAAKAYGQTDDITVVTVQRTGSDRGEN